MKAPDKIYLQVCGDCQDNDCDNCKFEDLEDNVTWAKERIFEKDVEYVRKDAFVEEVYNYLKNYAFVDDDKNVHLPTLLHDFLKDSRTF